MRLSVGATVLSGLGPQYGNYRHRLRFRTGLTGNHTSQVHKRREDAAALLTGVQVFFGTQRGE